MPKLFSLTELLTIMVQRHASDLHILIGLPPTMRISGQLITVEDAEPSTADGLSIDLKSALLPEIHEKYLRERTADASYTLPDGSRFRFNVYTEKGNPALAARFIPTIIPSLNDLQVPDAVRKFLDLRSGLVLVTGPTGAGKTTLLASMLEEINITRRSHIITFEDPPEFLFKAKESIISQLEYGKDFLTFQSALSHALRQDPNIILVGEMRDLETMGAALTLAETGHLVFATLHTNGAAQTVERVINAFPPHQQTQVRLQMSLILRGIVSQLLLPSNNGTLVPVREVLVNNFAIAHLIAQGKTDQIQNVILSSAGEGMQTLDQDLMALVEQSIIPPELAQKYSNRPQKYEGMVGEEEAAS